MPLRITAEPEDMELIRLMKEDPIGRNAELRYLLRLLDANKNGLSVFLNGTWGCGKSYFVRQATLMLQALNPYLINPEGLSAQECNDCVINVGGNDRDGHRRYLPVYFNAWEHDSFGEPVFSLMADIADMEDMVRGDVWDDNKIKELLKLIGKHAIKLTLPFAAEFADDVTEYLDLLSGIRKAEDDPLKEYKDRKKLEEHVNKLIVRAREIAGHNIRPADAIVMFIDELDRCKPTYAIEVLESVKHLLLRPDVIVIFSVDVAQLVEAIKGAYGSGYDAERYLRRFYDLQLRLPEIDAERFSLHVLKQPQRAQTLYDSVVRALTASSELTMRDYLQLHNMFERAKGIETSNNELQPLDKLVFDVLRPLTCYLQVTRPIILDSIIRNGDIDEVTLSYANNINVISNTIDQALAYLPSIWTKPYSTMTKYDSRRHFLSDLLLVYLTNENVSERTNALKRIDDSNSILIERRSVLRAAQELWADNS